MDTKATNNRKLNIKRNIPWAIANKTILLLLPFALRTVMLRMLGSEYVGLSGLYTSILQVLNIAELGVSSAIVFCMYKPVSENDTQKLSALLNYFRTLYTRLGLVVMAGGIIIIPFLKSLISGDVPGDINIYILYIAYLLNTALSYLVYGYRRAILNANQRYDLISKIDLICKTIMYGLQIFAVIVTKNYYLVILLMPVFTLAENLGISYASKKRYPAVKPEGELSRDEKSIISKQFFGLLVISICATTRNSLDSIYISSFLGLNSVAQYGNYYYIISSIHGVMIVLITAAKASVGNYVSTNSKEAAYSLMIKLSNLYLLAAALCSCFLVCFYQDIMEIWAGSALLLPTSTVILFIAYFYALMIGDIKQLFFDTTGLWWNLKSVSIIETIANIGLNTLGVLLLGIDGVILGTLISLIIVNFSIGSTILIKNYFGKLYIKNYFIKYATLTGKSLIYVTAVRCIMELVSVYVSDRLIARFGLFTFLIALILMLEMLLNKSMKKTVKNFLHTRIERT